MQIAVARNYLYIDFDANYEEFMGFINIYNSEWLSHVYIWCDVGSEKCPKRFPELICIRGEERSGEGGRGGGNVKTNLTGQTYSI